MMEKLRARMPAVVDRIQHARTPSPRFKRVSLALALLVFVVATVLAVRALPPLPPDGRQPALFVAVAALAAMAIVVNGAEYALSGAALGGRVPLGDATRISVLSTAANLLPIPGAAIVKTRALQRRGHGLRIAATLTIAIGIIWVGVAGLMAGILVATTGHRAGLGVGLSLAGLVILVLGAVILANQKTVMSSRALVAWALAIEIVSVSLTSVRFYLVLRAIGFDGSFAQSATLAATAIVASAAGIFPGGLGLRELLSSAVGPAVGLSSAVSTVVAAVERIVALAVVALMALAVMFIDRHDDSDAAVESGPSPTSAPESAPCA
jgi:hypothetical protein